MPYLNLHPDNNPSLPSPHQVGSFGEVPGPRKIKRTYYRFERPDFESLEGLTVLLVEDNHVNQLVASTFLSQWDIRTEITTDGKQAVEMVKNQDYDLVLMDLQIPEMDGYTAAEMIRRIEGDKYKNLPIIAITGFAQPETESMVAAKGMNDCITKPFNPNELYYKIKKYTLQN